MPTLKKWQRVALSLFVYFFAATVIPSVIYSFYVHGIITDHNLGQSRIWGSLQVSGEQVKSLRVLTYNVHGLPNVKEPTCDNLIRIGEKLRDMRKQGTAPHIVAIQEGFHEKIKDLIRISGYPYVAEGRTEHTGEMTSGLWILSEFPISDNVGDIYSSCVSWDCLANKGIQRVVIRIPGKNEMVELEVFNTHMNAFLNGGDIITAKKNLYSAKFSQVNQFYKFVSTNRKTNMAMLMVGDFNFRAGDVFFEEFQKLFKKEIEAIRHASSTLLSRTVDHQFSTRIKPRSFRKIFTLRDSDHRGILVEYDIY